MVNKGIHRMTSFLLPITLYTQLKTMCMLTNTQMGEFIRIAIRDKIKQIQNKEVK